jgi:hypothetical protein
VGRQGYQTILQTGKSLDPLGRRSTKTLFFLNFLVFFLKKLEKYDLTRPKVSKYSLTSWPEVIVVFHGEYKGTVTHTLKFSLPHRAYDGLRESPRRVEETSLPWGGCPRCSSRSSWRALLPEHLCRQNPLRGPTPETWVLTNHQQPDTTTIQRRGSVPVGVPGALVLLLLPDLQLELLLYAIILPGTVPNLQIQSVQTTC